MFNLLDASNLFLKKHGSTILTFLGAGGVIATAVLAANGAPKAAALLENAKKEKGEDLTVIEKVKIAGPAYIPAIVTGSSTIACIFGANALNKHTQASLASAYALLDTSYKEFKKKVRELYGNEAESNVRLELAKDVYEGNYISEGGEKKLFFDYYSLNYFESTDKEVQWAEDRINELLSTRGYALLSEYYDLLGLRVDMSSSSNYAGYDLGWSRVSCPRINFLHELATMNDGLECCIVSILDEPTPELLY